MGTISKTFVAVNISIAGVDCEQEAEVKDIHTRAFGAIYEKGGQAISPPEPETAEIQSVKVSESRKDSAGNPIMHDILYLLTDDQVQAIETEILDGE